MLPMLPPGTPGLGTASAMLFENRRVFQSTQNQSVIGTPETTGNGSSGTFSKDLSIFTNMINVDDCQEDGSRIMFDRASLQAECTIHALVEKICSKGLLKWGIIKRFDGKLAYQFLMRKQAKRAARTHKQAIVVNQDFSQPKFQILERGQEKENVTTIGSE